MPLRDSFYETVDSDVFFNVRVTRVTLFLLSVLMKHRSYMMLFMGMFVRLLLQRSRDNDS